MCVLVGISLVGIPKLKWSGTEGDYNVMVMDLLGPNLEDLFNFCKRQFCLGTVISLAEYMVGTVSFANL